ncbi:hypothetical protein V8C42DRAFT_324550 [Trichoderma barbatum]
MLASLLLPATLLAEAQPVENKSPTEADVQPKHSRAAYPREGRAEGADIVLDSKRYDTAGGWGLGGGESIL